MRKTWKNKVTGLVLKLDGTKITLEQPGQPSVPMGFGEEEYAADLAERLARDLRAVEVKEGEQAA